MLVKYVLDTASQHTVINVTDTKQDFPIAMARASGEQWQIAREIYDTAGRKYVRVDGVILAQSRDAADTRGTMARMYAAGEMGSAPPLASYLAGKATVNDSEVTP